MYPEDVLSIADNPLQCHFICRSAAGILSQNAMGQYALSGAVEKNHQQLLGKFGCSNAVVVLAAQMSTEMSSMIWTPKIHGANIQSINVSEVQILSIKLLII